jgi:hypothetical protein
LQEGKDFAKGALEIFRGTLPPQRSARRKTCLSAMRRELVFRQRSEDALGRKMSSDPAKTFSHEMKEFL